MTQMTPQEIVHELDKHIVGQGKAKKAVAIALRNRWRRAQVEEPLRQEITPKNILMIGPTGVGKTEIARRLARLANAPFIKIEATKFTEVGYVVDYTVVRRHDLGEPAEGEQGARVALIDYAPSAAVAGELGGETFFQGDVDLTDAVAAGAAIDAVAERFGGLDALVNVAGVGVLASLAFALLSMVVPSPRVFFSIPGKQGPRKRSGRKFSPFHKLAGRRDLFAKSGPF